VQKSYQHSGKMTGTVYLEVSEKAEATKKAGRFRLRNVEVFRFDITEKWDGIKRQMT